MSSTERPTRRGVFITIGAILNAAATLAIGIPVLRYLFSPKIRERRPGYDSWLPLRPVSSFPIGEARFSPVPPVLPNAACSNIGTRTRATPSSSRQAKCRPPVVPWRSCRSGGRRAPDRTSRPVVRRARPTREHREGSPFASRATPDGELVLRLRKRGAHRLRSADRHRDPPRLDLRPFGGGGVEQLAHLESERIGGLGPPGASTLGVGIHGRPARPHT